MAQLNFDIKQNHSNWLIIAVILLAASIRLPNLSVQSIAFDESFSLVVGLADWPTLFGAILSDGVHPPLFYVIHKGAFALWGTSEFGQRFFAAAFSDITVRFLPGIISYVGSKPLSISTLRPFDGKSRI